MRHTITLTKRERMELRRRANSRTGRAEDARRARVILLLAEGRTWDVVCERVACSRSFVASWSQRFADARLAGPYSRHRGQAPMHMAPRVEARILAATRRVPADGSTHWSTRKLASQLGVSHMRVVRVWAKHGLKPYRLERYLASNDPDFETKAADVIGLYLHPPAACGRVLCGREDRDPGPGPQGSGAPLVAGAGGTTWLRILSSRHVVPVRGVQHEDGRGLGQDRATPHLG
jgi:transposase